MRPAEAAACHQGALGSNRSWKGLSSGPVLATVPSGPSPHRQMVDLGIDSSAEAICRFVNSFVTAEEVTGTSQCQRNL